MALEPITRKEKIIAGENLEPITRMEQFLKKFGGGGGGSGAEYVKLIRLPAPEVSVKEFSDALAEQDSNGALILWDSALIFYGAVFGKTIYFYADGVNQYSVSSTDVGDDLSKCYLNIMDIQEVIPAALYIQSENHKKFEITIDDSGTISATEVT